MDEECALRVARQLRSGTVMINSDALSGGCKQSGNAREWGKSGLEEYKLKVSIHVMAGLISACLVTSRVLDG